MFAKRHYEFLARFFAYELSVAKESQNARDYERRVTIEGLTRLLASELGRDNPRFNREKFLQAASVAE